MNWIERIDNLDLKYLQELRDCTHAFSEDKPNPWHTECSGNVFGHSNMVYENAIKFYPEDEILQLACLLHDIAKPFCREVCYDKEKVKFYSHENMGVFLAIEILDALELKENDKIRVLELIQRHADTYKLAPRNLIELFDQDSFNDAMKIRKCDMLGRVALVSDETNQDVEIYNKTLELKIPEISPKTPGTGIRCILLIGPPCSGKSTFTKDYQGIIISRDNIIMNLSNSEDYNVAWHEVDQTVVDRLLQEEINFAIDEEKEFAVDMTNMTVKARRKFTANKKLSCEAIVFLTRYDELIKRNKAREGKVLKEFIIVDMCKRFQMPYPGEGFKSVKYIF